MTILGTVQACWRYPVKSMQGHRVDALDLGPTGVAGDRVWGVIDTATGHLLSAKRASRLLEAIGDDDRIVLSDGTSIATDDPAVHEALSAWLDRPVRLAHVDPEVALSYEMTFDPPNDDAEQFEIPAPPGTFLDLAAIHAVTTATLAGCAAARGDLDWDVRRFRPNVVLDVEGPVFVEQDWVGRTVRLGDAAIDVAMPTVRCAMPLRAQPALGAAPALSREPGIFSALNELNTVSPNHLGIYATCATPGTIRVGDPVELVD